MGLTIQRLRGRGAGGRIAILAVLALAAFAFVAKPARAFEIAVQDDRTFLAGTSYSKERAYNQARAIGATLLRVNVVYADWVRFGPGPYDSLVDRARAHGLRLQMTLLGTPRYYERSAPRAVNYRYPSPVRFASFAHDVASHFRGRVGRYSIWNEPNVGYFLGPQNRAPSMYANLFKAGYRSIKAIDRRAQVLFGELYSGNLRGIGGTAPMRFLQRAARGAHADGLAYHPFQYNFAPDQRNRRFVALASISTIKANLRDLARRGRLRTSSGRPLPIYFTEFGYQVLGSWAVRPESKRARWIAAAFRLAKRSGVHSMLYYHLIRTNARSWDSGLITLGGTPLPAYRALLSARRSLVGR